MDTSAQGAGNPTYPVRISANRRYLVDAKGAPYLIHGDTAWSLLTALMREEVELYLADRAAKGFNSIIVNLIEHKFNGPVNRYGEGPFATPGDFSTPNETYFAHADWVIRQAAGYGIQVLLAPIYLGAMGTDEGWVEEVLANGVESCREWGRYVGRRYGAFDNIIWLIGGDRNPGEALDHVDAVVEGIKQFDNRHLFTAHTCSGCSPVIEYARGGWVNLNNTYTYGIVQRQLLADYNRQPVMPFFLIESTYEGEHNASAVQVRRQAYWAILCGGCGQFMGNLPIWLFNAPGAPVANSFFLSSEGRDSTYQTPGWKAALDSRGAQDMVHLKALFASRPWHQLVPDQRHEIVTRGLGEFRGLDYLAAARTYDGGTVIAYMPTARAITIDLSRICGRTVRAWWFDPRTSKAQSAGEFTTEGSREFAPPADGDWVLVLDDTGRGYPAPGATAHE